MIFYTLNTGQVHQLSHLAIADEAIGKARAWLELGMHDLPVEGFRLTTVPTGRGLIVDIYRLDRTLISTMAVADDDATAAEVWPVLAKLYYWVANGARHHHLTKGPEPVPWCAVVLVDLAICRSAAWIQDVHQSLALAWLESKGCA